MASVVENTVVLPGDSCPHVTEAAVKSKIVLGPGLRKEHNSDKRDNVVSSRAGIVRKHGTNIYWVEGRARRYVPARGENVVGTVVQKAGDVYRVDVGGSCTAALSYLSFEGATKKNRPDVQVGDVVYARVSVASRDMEPELVCVESDGKKGRLGVLQDGYVFNCSLNLARKILSPACPLVDSLRREWPLELAVGHNGRVWIRAGTGRETVALGNAILAAEHKSAEEIRGVCGNISSLLASGR